MTDTQTAFVLVPREPTPEMIEACDGHDNYWGYEGNGKPCGPADAYRAMLSAAPKPPCAGIVWPEPRVLNPDIAAPTGVPYLDCLLHRLLDAQQDINLAANEGMSQPLADAAALIDEVEAAIRKMAAPKPPESEIGPVAWGAWSARKQAVIAATTDLDQAMKYDGIDDISVTPLYHQARIDADAAIIAALRAEVAGLQSFADGYGKLDADFAIAERRAEAAEARVKELEEAIDSAETNAGLTDNGNLWRFWSAKASDLAANLKQTEGWLEGRDAFLIKRDLWTDFVDQLPTSPSRAALAAMGSVKP